MFLNKIRNIFCVPNTNFVSATNVARGQTGKQQCVLVCQGLKCLVSLLISTPFLHCDSPYVRVWKIQRELLRNFLLIGEILVEFFFAGFWTKPQASSINLHNRSRLISGERVCESLTYCLFAILESLLWTFNSICPSKKKDFYLTKNCSFCE